MIVLYTLLVLIILILAVLFPVTYYYISTNLRKEIEKNLHIILQITEKTTRNKKLNAHLSQKHAKHLF